MILGWALGPGDGFGFGFGAQEMVWGWFLGPGNQVQLRKCAALTLMTFLLTGGLPGSRSKIAQGMVLGWSPRDGLGMGFGSQGVVFGWVLGPGKSGAIA